MIKLCISKSWLGYALGWLGASRWSICVKYCVSCVRICVVCVCPPRARALFSRSIWILRLALSPSLAPPWRLSAVHIGGLFLVLSYLSPSLPLSTCPFCLLVGRKQAAYLHRDGHGALRVSADRKFVFIAGDEQGQQHRGGSGNPQDALQRCDTVIRYYCITSASAPSYPPRPPLPRCCARNLRHGMKSMLLGYCVMNQGGSDQHRSDQI